MPSLVRAVIRCVIASLVLYPAFAFGQATNIYITANGSPAGSCTTSIQTPAFFNNSANWGSGAGQIGPGTTVLICGTFTAAPGGNLFTFRGSGTSGNPITLLFDTNAILQAPYFGNTDPGFEGSGAIELGPANSYTVVDGGTNGVIQETANGTLLANQLDSVVIEGYGSNATIQNLTIKNLYVRAPYPWLFPSGTEDCNQYGKAFSMGGSSITIENNIMTNAGADVLAVGYGATPTSNVLITGNTIIGYNHAITVAAGQGVLTPQISSVTISNNHLDGMDVFEGCANLHRDGIFIFNEGYNNDLPTGSINGLTISGNSIGPGINPHTNDAGTAAIFFHGYNPDYFVNVLIYNNVLTLKSPLAYGDGYIAPGGLTNALIANNTIIGWVGSGTTANDGNALGALGENIQVYNNLIWEVSHETGYATFAPAPLSVSSDHNIFYNFGLNAFSTTVFTITDVPEDGGTATYYTDTASPSTYYSTLPQWQAAGFDLHSSTNQPAIDSNGIPLHKDTVAQGQGVNLSSYFTTDKNGNPRTGAWTIGAYNAMAANGDVTPPTISIVTPTNGSTVSGIVNITGTASDNVEVAYITVYFGDSSTILLSPSAWSYSVNTLGLPNGSYSVTAQATDEAENTGVASSTFTVSNSGGPVDWWKLNEGYGTTAHDSGTNGETGTLQGGFTWVTGLSSNTAVSFNGTSGYMNTSTAVSSTTYLTLTAWFNSMSASAGNFIAFGNGPVATTSGYDRELFMKAGGQISFQVLNSVSGNYVSINSPLSYNDGNWHQAAASLGPAGMQLYVDGVLVSNGTSTTSSQNLSFAPGYWRAAYANIAFVSANAYFNGSLDDIRVYNRVLSAGEIAALDAAGPESLLAGPIGANSAPGLNAAVVYPNPVVPPYNPTIRVCPGIVDSVDVTIFDMAGRVVNSGTVNGNSFVPSTGVGAGQYCYEYTWTGHISSGVYFAVIHAKGSGTTVKARLKFAVIR